MQRLKFQHTDINQFSPRASRVMPGHGTGIQDQAANDDVCNDRTSRLWLVMSILGNVIGGGLLLYGLVLLPHVIAKILS